jgi:hypothetical protein
MCACAREGVALDGVLHLIIHTSVTAKGVKTSTVVADLRTVKGSGQKSAASYALDNRNGEPHTYPCGAGETCLDPLMIPFTLKGSGPDENATGGLCSQGQRGPARPRLWNANRRQIQLPAMKRAGAIEPRVNVRRCAMVRVRKVAAFVLAGLFVASGVMADTHRAGSPVTNSADRRVSLSAVDLGTGSEREIYKSEQRGGITPVALSSEGRTLAFGLNADAQRQLAVVSVNGGPVRILATFRDSDGLGNALAWAPDGRSLFVVRRTDGGADRGTEVWRYYLDDSGPRRAGVMSPSIITSLSLSAAGELAYTAGSPGDGSEAWLLENVLPAPKPRSKPPAR